MCSGLLRFLGHFGDAIVRGRTGCFPYFGVSFTVAGPTKPDHLKWLGVILVVGFDLPLCSAFRTIRWSYGMAHAYRPSEHGTSFGFEFVPFVVIDHRVFVYLPISGRLTMLLGANLTASLDTPALLPGMATFEWFHGFSLSGCAPACTGASGNTANAFPKFPYIQSGRCANFWFTSSTGQPQA